MTFCLGIKVKEGLVGIADTRIAIGAQYLSAKKYVIKQNSSQHQTMFLMTSGLRALRDKTVTYFDQECEQEEAPRYNKLHKVVNRFGEILRRVAKEDKTSLEESGVEFNLFVLIAGQLVDDNEHKLFMVFPQGNWVEVGERSPFFMIGNSAHGRLILDRVLRYDSTMDYALKTGFLAVNVTQVSVNDVAYPIDVVLYKKNSYDMVVKRFERDDLKPYMLWWQERILQLVDATPM